LTISTVCLEWLKGGVYLIMFSLDRFDRSYFCQDRETGMPTRISSFVAPAAGYTGAIGGPGFSGTSGATSFSGASGYTGAASGTGFTEAAGLTGTTDDAHQHSLSAAYNWHAILRC
jgi:hypothetical protein